MEKINIKDWKKLPNLISLFRIIFIPIIIILFENYTAYRWYIVSCLIFFSVLDNLDGFVARKLNQITELGKVIDPLVDKLFMIIIALMMFKVKLVPDWFLILVIARDLIIMIAGLFFIKNLRKVPPSDFMGKLTAGAIGFVFLISFLNFQELKLVYESFLGISTLLIILSLINYGIKQFKRAQ
ncbi:MAG: CDP-alcohol phosphatidyltransferase family protein [Ignavibacteria bacterium]